MTALRDADRQYLQHPNSGHSRFSAAKQTLRLLSAVDGNSTIASVTQIRLCLSRSAAPEGKTSPTQ
jgi:hypothetical protein